MSEERTYTAAELEQRSGFDRRTIAYYVQEDLLPRVGRRGRGTRYGQEFLNRLLFIRRVRDLQDAGRLRAVTLREIREVMTALSADLIARAAADDVPVEEIRTLFAEPDLDTALPAVPAEVAAARHMGPPPSMLDEALAQGELLPAGMRGPTAGRRAEPQPATAAIDVPMGKRLRGLFLGGTAKGREESAPPAALDSADLERLAELLREIDRRVSRATQLRRGETTELVTRVPVTEEILLSVRNLDSEGAALVEEVAEILRGLGRL